jgi:O-antigen/teichoic acid export membrane protein
MNTQKVLIPLAPNTRKSCGESNNGISRKETDRRLIHIVTLRQKTISSIGWSASNGIGNQIVQFITSIVLARLLAPQDFGLIGMLLVFTGFAGLFSEFGFGSAIIQRPSINERHLSSVFWLNVGMGLAMTVIMFAAAPFIASFYREPQLLYLTRLFSLNFLIGALIIVPKALFQRQMDFRSLFGIGLAINVVSGIIVIALAMQGFGVWSLAWQSLSIILVSVILIWKFSPWRPTLLFDIKAVGELIKFSGNLQGFRVFNYWIRNVDNFLIGKFFGTMELGIYSRAYNIMLLPMTQISWIVGQVMFSSLSKMQGDKAMVKYIYLKTIRAIALISFPMMAGLFVVADSFVIFLLGPQWVDVIPVLRIFCFVGMIQSISTTIGWIYNSQGRTDVQFLWGIGSGVLLMGSFVAGILIGNIVAVALCYAVVECVILLYPAFAIPGRLVHLRFREVLQSVHGILGCTLAMSLGVYAFGICLPSELPQWLQLLSKTAEGIILYSVFIHFFKLDAYLDVKALFLEQWALYMAKDKLT